MPLVLLTTLKWVDFEGFLQIASSPETLVFQPSSFRCFCCLFEGRVSREMIEFEGVYSSHPRRNHIFGWFSVMSFWRCISHCWFRRCHPTHLFDKSVFCMGPFVLAPITESPCSIFRHRISQLDLLSPPKVRIKGAKEVLELFRIVSPWQVLVILSNGIGKKCSVENAQLSKMVSHHRLSHHWCYKTPAPQKIFMQKPSPPKTLWSNSARERGLAGPKCLKIQGDFIIDVITIETLQENKENYTRFMLNNGDSVPLYLEWPMKRWWVWILTTLRGKTNIALENHHFL